MTDPYAALRAAIDAGPTPGPWAVSKSEPTPGEWQQSHRMCGDGMYRTQVFCKRGKTIADLAWYPMPTIDGVTRTYREANARLIAAANPDTLARLLAERDALADQVQALTDDRDSWAKEADNRLADGIRIAGERDALAADARRYRILCEYQEWTDAVLAAFDCGSKQMADDAIDAMAAQREGGA